MMKILLIPYFPYPKVLVPLSQEVKIRKKIFCRQMAELWIISNVKLLIHGSTILSSTMRKVSLLTLEIHCQNLNLNFFLPFVH